MDLTKKAAGYTQRRMLFLVRLQPLLFSQKETFGDSFLKGSRATSLRRRFGKCSLSTKNGENI